MATGQFARILLYALPATAVAVVAFATLVLGASRPYRAARIRGGPTRDVSVLAWRVEAFERLGDRERPLSGEVIVSVSHGGVDVSPWRGRLDADGAVYPSIALEAPTSDPIDVVVEASGHVHPLVRGRVSLDADAWRRHATRRGGWLIGPREGALELYVAPARGVFAVPFSDELWVEVRRRGQRLPGATVTLVVDGARVEAAEKITDERGRARWTVTPLEHAVSFSVRARSGDDHGRFAANLPVIPGALWVARDDERLRVESAIVRDAAYLSLVSESARLSGAAIRLEPDGRGGAVGTYEIAPWLRERRPLWAVVSSEPDQRSMALVGWPIDPATTEPSSTFDVRDELLLDGSRAAFDAEAQRVRHVRRYAALFALSAMGLTIVLLAVRIRHARRLLESHLSESSGGEVVPSAVSNGRALSGVLAVLVSLFLVALGFAAIALFTMLR